MQVTIDDDTFHKWALDRGYVLLSDITEFVRHQSEPRPEQIVEVMKIADAAIDTALAGDSFTDQVAALENLDDLKPAEPVPTFKEVFDALKDVVDKKGPAKARELLNDFGIAKIGDLPEEKRSAFIAVAEKVLS